MAGGFWRATGERGVRVFSWSLLATLGSGTVGVTSMPWSGALNIAVGVAVLEVIACVAAGRVGPQGPGLSETLPRKEAPL